MYDRTFRILASNILGQAMAIETAACSAGLLGRSGTTPNGGRSGTDRIDECALGRIKGHVVFLAPEDYEVPVSALRLLLSLMLAQAHRHSVTRAR